MKVPKIIREMPWPEPFNSGNTGIHFRVTFSWPVVEGHRLMVATFSRNQKRPAPNWKPKAWGPDFRLVCDKAAKGYAVIEQGSKGQPLRDLYRLLYKNFHTVPAACYPEISEKDEKALCRWLGYRPSKDDISQNHAMPQLDTWTEQAVAIDKRHKADLRGELRDEDVMLCPEELPVGLLDYIRKQMLPDDAVLVYKKGNVRGTCYLCGKKVHASGGNRFKQGHFGDCPNCGGHVRYALEGGNLFCAEQLENVATIQLGTDGVTLFIRQWKISRPKDPAVLWEQTETCLHETARYAVRGHCAAKWQKEAKENWYMNTYRYWLNDWTRMKKVSEIYDGSYEFFLPRNWRQIVKPTSLRYIDLPGGHKGIDHRRNVIRFMLDWARYPAVELLWKAGYTDIVTDKVTGAISQRCRGAIRWSKTSIQDAVQFPLRLLKSNPPKEWTVEMVRETAKAWALVVEGKLKESEIPDLADLVKCHATMEHIEVALGHSTIHKIVKYLEQQRQRKKAARAYDQYVGQTYRDYLQDCVTLELNLDDKGVLFPPNLDEAHHRTTTQIRYKVDKEKAELFKKAVSKLEKWAWEKDGLLIRPPKSQQELIDEGETLHHCVGGYVNTVAKGGTAIFFIRSKKDPKTPFYTLELQDKRVIQCRTKCNEDYRRNKEISAFVDAWMKNVVLKKKSTKARTGAAKKKKEDKVA